MPRQLLPFEIEAKPLKQMEVLPMEDLEELKYRLMRTFNLDLMEGGAHGIGVRTEQDAKYALSMALQARKLEKTLEDSRSQIVKPHFDYQKAINKLVKDFKDKLISIEENLHQKIDSWMQQQNDNPFTAIDKIEVEDGTLTTKKCYDFTVEDATQVPSEYKSVDKEAVTQAIKYGTRKIPGIKIVEKTETALRVKN